MSREPGIRGNLRPDLFGVELGLTDADTDELGLGEEATIVIAGVYDAGDTENLRVRGLWRGPDTVQQGADVLVKATSLPPHTAQGAGNAR